MRNVTKEIFLNAVACPTLGWLLRCDGSTSQLIEESRTLGAQFLMEQGLEIHNRARQLYPDGILVQRRNYTASLEETMRLMKDPNVLTIFEATFLIQKPQFTLSYSLTCVVSCLSRLGIAKRIVFY